MKIKVLIISLAAVFAAAGVVLFMNLEGDNNPYFNENLEALMDTESEIPTLPCVKAVSICRYYVKDADGNIYSAETTGLKNI
jgi:hypothetical protein